jgi:hypothetical protein
MSLQERLDEAVVGLTRFKSEVGLSQVDSRVLRKAGILPGSDPFKAHGWWWTPVAWEGGRLIVMRGRKATRQPPRRR